MRLRGSRPLRARRRARPGSRRARTRGPRGRDNIYIVYYKPGVNEKGAVSRRGHAVVSPLRPFPATARAFAGTSDKLPSSLSSYAKASEDKKLRRITLR